MSLPPRYQLKGDLQRVHFFALSFGAIVGVGWIVVLGNWLEKAGPAGAILAFVAGGIVSLVVGFSYAKMGALFPVSGGEVAYTYALFGLRTCYATGWFLTLSYIATTIFEAVSVGWVADTLAPGINGPILYTVRGAPVHLGGLLLGLVGMVAITTLNYIGVKPASRVQNVFTYLKIVLVAVVAVAAVGWGQTSNLHPLFLRRSGGILWAGVFSVFVTTPFWLSGFNSVAQVLEEKAPNTSPEKVSRMILFSIAASVLFYTVMILACSMTMPWMQLLRLNLPAASAFETGLHSHLLSRAVLLIALLGNVTVWNSNFLSGTRVLFALGRARIISRRFGAPHPVFGSPTAAVVFVGILGTSGIALGRSAILPMVGLASSTFAIAYILVCYSAFKVQQMAPLKDHGLRGRATAAAGIVVSVCILVLTLYQPYLDAGKTFPLEWGLFLAWSILGALFWTASSKLRRSMTEFERRQLILGGEQDRASQC
jgi:APA family basic amino acid/polyamine antiporter